MKNFTVAISFILLCTSCLVHKGQWVNGECRPKNPNFKLLKVPFNRSEKLTFNRVYQMGVNVKSFGIGFYSDGRLIFFVTTGDNELNRSDVLGKKWENAGAIGYWRAEGNQIKIEYFVCGDFGTYIEKKGEIKGDTLIFERDCGTSNPFKSVKCPEKYVLSDLSFD